MAKKPSWLERKVAARTQERLLEQGYSEDQIKPAMAEYVEAEGPARYGGWRVFTKIVVANFIAGITGRIGAFAGGWNSLSNQFDELHDDFVGEPSNTRVVDEDGVEVIDRSDSMFSEPKNSRGLNIGKLVGPAAALGLLGGIVGAVIGWRLPNKSRIEELSKQRADVLALQIDLKASNQKLEAAKPKAHKPDTDTPQPAATVEQTPKNWAKAEAPVVDHASRVAVEGAGATIAIR